MEMTRGKLSAGWGMVASIVRVISHKMVGEEPQLNVYIPNEFLPEDLKHREKTPEQKAKDEEYKRKKAELDMRILAQLAREGKLKGIRNGRK